MEYGYTVIVRKTRGDDIDAACGQLVGDVIDRTKRTMKKRAMGENIAVCEAQSHVYIPPFYFKVLTLHLEVVWIKAMIDI